MKYLHRIARLLVLAAAGCVVAAALTGCTQEEIRSAYNEIMFGDWIGKSSSAASTPAYPTPDYSEDESHEYDPPNPECDAKIDALVNELYGLEASARSDVDSAVQSAKDEYHALPASQQNWYNKLNIASKHLYAVQFDYDARVSAVVSEMRSILREYNQPETVADWAESYYASAKASMEASLYSQA